MQQGSVPFHIQEIKGATCQTVLPVVHLIHQETTVIIISHVALGIVFMRLTQISLLAIILQETHAIILV